MLYLIAKKEFVYLFEEDMYTDLVAVETNDDDLSFLDLAKNLDYVVLGYGKNLNVDELLVPTLTINDFARPFFNLKENKNIIEGSSDILNKYCDHLENYLELTKKA